MMEAKSLEFRSSKRSSREVRYEDWCDEDYVVPEVLTSGSKRDELTCRGIVSYVEDVTVVEFETLEDMKLYDSVAEKWGIPCCASFNEFSRPFRGFSQEERHSSKNYLFRFKKSTNDRDCLKPGCADSGDNIQQVPKPTKSYARCKKGRFMAEFKGSSICVPHRKNMCVLCRTVAKFQKKKHDKLTPLTPTSSPIALFSDQTAPSGDPVFEISIEDELQLTADRSSRCFEQGSRRPDTASPVKDIMNSGPIDMASIPYIFRCYAPHKCQSSKICANKSSVFTLCLKITAGKGRAFSKLATKYLDEYKEFNIIDRLSATIAASAVDSSVSTFFLPIKNELISCVFQLSSQTQSMDPHSCLKPQPNDRPNSINIHKPPEFSNHDEESWSSYETTGFHEDLEGIPLESLITKRSSNNGAFSNSACNIIFKDFNDENDLLHNLPKITTKDPVTKRPLESISFSECERLPKVSKGGSDRVEWNVKAQADFVPDSFETFADVYASSTPELDPLRLDYQGHRNSSPIQIASPKAQRLEQSRHISKCDWKSQNGPSLLIKRPAQTSSTESQNCTSPASKASSVLEQSECSSTSLNVLSHCIPITPEKFTNNSSDAVIDLTTVEDDSTTVDQLRRTKKRKQLFPCTFQLPEKVIFIDDEDGEPCEVKKLKRKKEPVSSFSSSDDGMQKLNPTPNSDEIIIELNEDSEIDQIPSNFEEKFVDLTAGDLLHPPEAVLPPDKLGSAGLPIGDSRIGKTLSNSEEEFIDLTEDDLFLHQSKGILEAKRPSGKQGSADMIGRSRISETLSNSKEKFIDLTEGDSLHPPADKTGRSRISGTLSNLKEKFIDLTEGDWIHHPSEEILETKSPSDKLVSAGCRRSGETLSNSKGKFIDLTEGESLHPPLGGTIKAKPSSDELNSLSIQDGTFNKETEMPIKSLETPRGEGVTTMHLSAPASVQQLSVMCTTVPSLGYIKVGKYPSGELVLNETFTARVYKHFDDMKALNTYLNQRFDKMFGVRALGPLEWILVTAGVINLKKVRPIDPKVWFHPNDYFLSKRASELVALKKTRQQCVGVTNSANTSCPSTPEAIGQTEPRNMPKKNCVISMGNSTKISRKFSLKVNKEHCQIIGTAVGDNKQTTKMNANQLMPSLSGVKMIKPNSGSLATPQVHPRGRTLSEINDTSDSQHNNIKAGDQSFTNTRNSSESQPEVKLRPKIMQTFSLNAAPNESLVEATVHWGPKTDSITNKHSNNVSNPTGVTQNMTVQPNFQKTQSRIVHQSKRSSGNFLSSSPPSGAVLPAKDFEQSAASDSCHSIGLEKPNVSQPGTVLVNGIANQPVVNRQHVVPATSATSKGPSSSGQAVKVVLTHQPNVFPSTTQSVTLLPNKERDQLNLRAASSNMGSSLLQKPCASKPVVLRINQPNGKTLISLLPRPDSSTPSVNVQTVQSGKPQTFPTSNVTSASAHPVDKITTQSANQSKSSATHPATVQLNTPRPHLDQKSSNVQRIILSKRVGSHNEALLPGMKLVPLVTTNGQGAYARLTAAVAPTYNPKKCSKATVYFASDGNSASTQKFPSTVDGADQSASQLPSLKLDCASLNPRK